MFWLLDIVFRETFVTFNPLERSFVSPYNCLFLSDKLILAKVLIFSSHVSDMRNIPVHLSSSIRHKFCSEILPSFKLKF